MAHIDKAGDAIVQTQRRPHATRPGCEQVQSDIHWDGGGVTHWPPQPKTLASGMPEEERALAEERLHQRVVWEVEGGLVTREGQA